jgi:hypothetical protein
MQPGGSAAGLHEPRLVGQHDRLHPVPQLELREDVRDVRFTVAIETNSCLAISSFDRPFAISLSTSSSRSVSDSSSGGELLPGGGRRTNSSISRRVIVGASSASPAATVRTAAASCSGSTSLSRNPLAPDFIAS